jgi:multidrug efflux pump subunit AcrA (membrane-fusion protein)
VLAVPVSAVTLSADGSSRVQKDDSGTLKFVTVEPGLSAEGYVAVKPLDSALAPGDLVVVGFDDQGTAQR